MELTQRQEQILKTVVDQYVATAHPVGSAAVASSSSMPISSATVRNELAALEEMGLLRHLHTSGGRVPTNAGYRYYVERLMARAHLPNAEARTIRHQFHQAHTEVQEWLKLAATVMAHRMHNVGLVTTPRSIEVRLRHLEVISIHDNVALLILVLHEGTVLQEMVTLPQTYTGEELSAVADQLNAVLKGKTAEQARGALHDLPGLASVIGSMTENLLQRGEAQQSQVFHAGLGDLIRQPEFSIPRPGESTEGLSERLREMLEFLQHGFAVQQLIAGLPRETDINVVIGGESSADMLPGYSFVLGRYGDESEGTGYLGIVGPTRMEYPRAVALVRYMTDLMTDLMSAY
jgi:heat-inducible transcriptional repressor